MDLNDLRIHESYGKWAFFFDIDGTLADIAPTPEAAQIPQSTLQDLIALSRKTSVALISGRSISSIDAMTAPTKFPAAGQHGLEIRFGGENVLCTATNDELMKGIEELIRDFQVDHPGLLIESKGLSVAIHYRMRPDLAQTVHAFVDRLVHGREGDITRQRGKMVDEVRLHYGSKGTAVAAFMKTPEFRGKIPVFAGDDITDEDGFRVVNQLHGVSIQVGSSSRIAQFEMAAPATLRDWVRKIVTPEMVTT